MSGLGTHRQWQLAARPEGMVRESDFSLVEAPIPQPAEGEILIKTLYLSVAPVMRAYMLDGAGFEKPLEIGEVMRGRGVGRVVESNNPDFEVGDVVHGKLGWQEYSVNDGSAYYMMYRVTQRVAPFSTAIGVLGVTGFTSYLGLVDVGRAAPGDRLLVSGAAGGVGSIVGQIGRNLGCQSIVGIAGGEEKCRILTEQLGYDAAIDYRKGDVGERIAELYPDGFDIFFDNVGGPILDAALPHLRRHGRIVSCGRISEYLNDEGTGYALKNWACIGDRSASMTGFFIYEMESEFQRAETALAEWVAQGRLNYLEDILEGIEMMPRALIRLFEGANRGKQIVRIDPDAQ